MNSFIRVGAGLITMIGFASFLFVAIAALSGCASTPTEGQQLALDIGIGEGVTYLVEDGTTDPAKWAERASEIDGIAATLLAVDDGSTSTIAGLRAALAPVIAKLNLSPGRLKSANRLVRVLAVFVERKKDTSEAVSIKLFLQLIRDSAAVYLPAASTTDAQLNRTSTCQSCHTPARV